MLKIRLKRSGRKKRPYFHVVVAEHSNAAKGKYLEQLGGYNPLEKDGFKVDVDKLTEWIKKGAQPSDTVARLMKGKGVSGMESFILPMTNRSKKRPGEDSAKSPTTPESTEAKNTSE